MSILFTFVLWFFYKATFSPSKIFHSLPFYDLSPFFNIRAHFQLFFASLPLCLFLESHIRPLKKGDYDRSYYSLKNKAGKNC